MSFWDRVIVVGATAEIGSHTFHAAGIRRFAAKFDPQPFHLDEATARASLLGALCASGWHTASVSMRLGVDYRRNEIRRWVEAGNAEPQVGPSPGFTDLRWPKPVFAGDRVSFTQTVTAKRLSASRPGWGIVELAVAGVNQHGERVFSFQAAAFHGTG